MEEFDYELLFHLLCQQALKDEETRKVLTQAIEAAHQEMQAAKWEEERKNLLQYLNLKMNGKQGRGDLAYDALLHRFSEQKGIPGSEPERLQYIAEILQDMTAPETDYKSLAKRPAFAEVTNMLAMMFQLRNRSLVNNADTALIIKQGSENKLNLLPAGLFNSLFYSSRGDDWWMNHFKTIASGDSDDDMATIRHLGNIYVKHDTWGLEGPFREGEETDFNGDMVLLENGEAKII